MAIVCHSDIYEEDTVFLATVPENIVRVSSLVVPWTGPTQCNYREMTVKERSFRHAYDASKYRSPSLPHIDFAHSLFGMEFPDEEDNADLDLLDHLRILWDKRAFSGKNDLSISIYINSDQRGREETTTRYTLCDVTGPIFGYSSTDDPSFNVMLGLVSDLFQEIGVSTFGVTTNLMSLAAYRSDSDVLVWYNSDGVCPDPFAFTHAIIIDNGDLSEIESVHLVTPKNVYRIICPRDNDNVIYTVSYYGPNLPNRPIINPSVLPGVCSAFDINALSRHRGKRVVVLIRGGHVIYLTEATNLLDCFEVKLGCAAFTETGNLHTPIYVMTLPDTAGLVGVRVFSPRKVESLVAHIVVVVGLNHVIRETENYGPTEAVRVYSGSCPHHCVTIKNGTGHTHLNSEDMKYGTVHLLAVGVAEQRILIDYSCPDYLVAHDHGTKYKCRSVSDVPNVLFEIVQAFIDPDTDPNDEEPDLEFEQD